MEDYNIPVRVARYHNIYGPYGTFDGGREKAPAALCRKVIKAKNIITNFEVFNCGFNEYNYSKYQIINLIKKYLKLKFNVNFVNYSKDRRNYKVDFTKLKTRLKIKSVVNTRKAFIEIKKFIQKNKSSKLFEMGNFKITI